MKDISRPAPIVFGVCVLAVLIVLLLRQTPEQRFEAELADLAPEAALSRLAAADAARPLDDIVKARYGELALQAGDVGTARAVFQSLAARPRLRRHAELRLAGVARLEGDLGRAAEHLAAAYNAQPDPAIRLQLGAWYRQLRDLDAELGVLGSVPAQQLTPWEAGRLVELLGLTGRQAEARTLLLRLADAAPDDRDVWRARLLDFLIDTGEPRLATEGARRWIAADPAGDTLRLVVGKFLDRGSVFEATALTDEALAGRPLTAHPVLVLFAERGYTGAALALARRWLERERSLDAGGLATLSRIAALTGDLVILHRVLAVTKPGKAEPASLAGALEQVLRYGGPRAVLPFRALVTPAVADASPLLAAAIAAESGTARALHDALARAAGAPMAEWQTHVWASLSLRLRGTGAWPLLYAGLPPESPQRELLSRFLIAELPSGGPALPQGAEARAD